MIRLFILCIIFVSSLYSFDVYSTKVIKIDKNRLLVPKSSDINISIGSSGVLIKNLEGKDLIVSRVIVENIDKNISLKTVKSSLSNLALPQLKLLSDIGDKVILNYNYNKALVIVKNKEYLSFVQSKYPQIDFVLNDLYLLEALKKKPSQKSTQAFCSFYGINLILFKMDKAEYFIDCHSFDVIAKDYDTIEDNQTIIPFYNTLNIESKFKKSKDYFYNLFGVN